VTSVAGRVRGSNIKEAWPAALDGGGLSDLAELDILHVMATLATSAAGKRYTVRCSGLPGTSGSMSSWPRPVRKTARFTVMISSR
jgi:hypothetical protein